jgi:hypothetical protein
MGKSSSMRLKRCRTSHNHHKNISAIPEHTLRRDRVPSLLHICAIGTPALAPLIVLSGLFPSSRKIPNPCALHFGQCSSALPRFSPCALFHAAYSLDKASSFASVSVRVVIRILPICPNIPEFHIAFLRCSLLCKTAKFGGKFGHTGYHIFAGCSASR